MPPGRDLRGELGPVIEIESRRDDLVGGPVCFAESKGADFIELWQTDGGTRRSPKASRPTGRTNPARLR